MRRTPPRFSPCDVTSGVGLLCFQFVHGVSLRCSAGQTPQKMRQLYNSELLDIYCSQCCKKVNLLNDLEARLRNLKANRYNADFVYLFPLFTALTATS